MTKDIARVDKLILGLLMIKRHTIYEIKAYIGQYFLSMCSDSLGSIRAAVKKLRAQQVVTCREYVERNVKKKEYSITDKGRNVFLKWVHTSADLSSPKNMELAKFLFMGFVTKEKRLLLLDEIIGTLENKLSKLLQLQASVHLAEEKSKVLDYWKNDHEYSKGIQMATLNSDITQAADDIGDYKMLCLQYEIDMTKFQLEWFLKLRDKGAD